MCVLMCVCFMCFVCVCFYAKTKGSAQPWRRGLHNLMVSQKLGALGQASHYHTSHKKGDNCCPILSIPPSPLFLQVDFAEILGCPPTYGWLPVKPRESGAVELAFEIKSPDSLGVFVLQQHCLNPPISTVLRFPNVTNLTIFIKSLNLEM